MSQRTTFTVVAVALCVAVAATIAAVWAILRGPTAATTAEPAGDRANLVIDQATPPPPEREEQPRTEFGARQAANAALDSYAAGNYGAFWDSWTKESQKVISRADYERLFQLCKPPAEGLRFTINRVDVEGDTARVEVARLIATFTYTLRYENGQWRFVLPDDTRAEYQGRTVEQIAQQRRAKSQCAS